MKTAWINTFNAVLVILLIAGLISGDRSIPADRSHTATEIINRVSRGLCVLLMLIPMQHGRFAYSSKGFMFMSLFCNAVLMIAFLVLYQKNKYTENAYGKVLEVIASLIFALNGFFLKQYMLCACALVFAVTSVSQSDE